MDKKSWCTKWWFKTFANEATPLLHRQLSSSVTSYTKAFAHYFVHWSFDSPLRTLGFWSVEWDQSVGNNGKLSVATKCHYHVSGSNPTDHYIFSYVIMHYTSLMWLRITVKELLSFLETTKGDEMKTPGAKMKKATTHNLSCTRSLGICTGLGPSEPETTNRSKKEKWTTRIRVSIPNPTDFPNTNK